jgi:hypothetical protein
VADRIEQLAHDLRCERIDLVGHSEGGPSAGGSAAPAAPLLVQTSEGAVKHAGLENMVAIVRLTPPDIRSSRSRSAGEEDSTLKGGIRSEPPCSSAQRVPGASLLRRLQPIRPEPMKLRNATRGSVARLRGSRWCSSSR